MQDKQTGYWGVDDEPQPSNFAGYDLTHPPEPANTLAPPSEPIHWEASEYIHHDKNTIWYVIFTVVVLVVLGVSIWAQNWTFVALVIVMAVAMGMYAVRKPRQIHYDLTPRTLKIDTKLYSLNDFRSFGVVPDGGLYSIILIPVKRFMPGVTIYFAKDDGEQIVDVLGQSLPMEKMEHDFIDRLMRKIRF